MRRLTTPPRRVAPLALLVLAVAAGSAVAADPIMPLSDVRAGMTGTALTVVSGTQITSFPVTITDVQGTSDDPGGATILMRAEGPLMAQTGGIAEGMSGSPVYVTGADGVSRLVGAIAFGQGDEANVMGGITPIERMLAVSTGARALEVPPSVVARPVRMVHDRAQAVAWQVAHPGSRALYPLQRWSVAGVSPRLAPLVRGALGPRAQADTGLPRSQRPPVTLQPGATMTTLVMAGDLVMGAIGTVTWVDGTTVLGFGHPFTGAGPTNLLLGDGYVYNVVSAPIRGGSYKLGEPGNVLGMLTGDRRDAVVGRLGTATGIRVHTVARDTRRQTRVALDVLLADQPELAPFMGDILQFEPLLRARDGLLGGTLHLRVTFSGGDLPAPVGYTNVYAAAGDITGVANGAVARPFTVLLQNSLRVLHPATIDIDQTIEPDIRAARIVDATVVPGRVRAGGTARLRLTLQWFRGGATRVTVPFRVPARWDAGRTVLRVVPNDPAGFDPIPADLTGTLSGEAVRVESARALRSADLAMATATARPATRAQRVVRAVRRLSDDRHDAIRLLAPGEAADDVTAGLRVAVPGIVLSGGRAVVRFTVRH